MIALAAVILAPVIAHEAIVISTDMEPPAVRLPPLNETTDQLDPTRKMIGDSYRRKRGRITEVRLMGSPEELGAVHVRLLKEEQAIIESEMHSQFSHYVPLAPARWLLVDLARLKFQDLDQQLSDRHRREIAAQAAAFGPDPFSGMMDTYQRFVFLHSLYDIMLSFEHSPLVGCSSFVLTGEQTADGHTLVGRHFDFEGPAILDERKAVFLVFEDDRIPYASVSWPGFVGTTTGMNREGLSMVVHGARAGEPDPKGQPVAQTVRDVLGLAKNTGEAVALLQASAPMVPHMIMVADATGAAVVVERIPGQKAHLRYRENGTFGLTNHFEGPGRGDAKNQEVRAKTSTCNRRDRLDEVLSNLDTPSSVQDVVTILRDKKGVGDRPLPLGHRAAIDALISTHTVVMDTTSRVIWVNEGPHATGHFVLFDLKELLQANYSPKGPAEVATLPQDQVAIDGSYDRWVSVGSHHEPANPQASSSIPRSTLPPAQGDRP